MRRLFGDAVCAAPPDGDTCVLTPPAEKWMEQNNASMNGGHCEGFAVLSQMIYRGVVDPNQFGAARTADLQIQNNEPLQRELAYWFSTQGPIWGTQQLMAPKDAVTYLTSEYTKDPKNLFRLGIMKEDQTGGHAITAYGIRDEGAGIYWIMVYDNNYPGQERHMVVDTNADTWEYEASINPSVGPIFIKVARPTRSWSLRTSLALNNSLATFAMALAQPVKAVAFTLLRRRASTRSGPKVTSMLRWKTIKAAKSVTMRTENSSTRSAKQISSPL
jgi:hypothetical protein